LTKKAITFTFQKLDIVEDENLIPDFDVEYFESDIVKLFAETLQGVVLEMVGAYELAHILHVFGKPFHLREVQIDVEDGIFDEEGQQASSIWFE
jgi:hypothetical protein